MVDKLFLTDAEIAGKIGLATNEYRGAFVVLERDGFPPKDIQFGNRRYWPAVKHWLDSRYRLVPSSTVGNSAQHGAKKW